ncbi:hypothetical protein EDB80DRAFT_779524 [Ilyonectria destructans]|nr:hypothetical protein EDB80DRAFT_784449 [Ilyonectria destructans]KAH7001734.1 hypothetical protein EDB80DRAFT_779524 [Ilyonectria destructans]
MGSRGPRSDCGPVFVLASKTAITYSPQLSFPPVSTTLLSRQLSFPPISTTLLPSRLNNSFVSTTLLPSYLDNSPSLLFDKSPSLLSRQLSTLPQAKRSSLRNQPYVPSKAFVEIVHLAARDARCTLDVKVGQSGLNTIQLPIATSNPPTFQQTHSKLRTPKEQGQGLWIPLRADELENNLLNLKHSRFLDTAGAYIFSMLREPSGEAVTAHYDKPRDAQLAATAMTLADSLKQEETEDDIVWFERLRNWVASNRLMRPGRGDNDPGEPWMAMRVPLPPRTGSNLAMFSVKTPTQPNWTFGMKRPPILCTLPSIKIVGPLNLFLQRIFRPGIDKESPTTSYPTLGSNLWYAANMTSIQAECDAVTDLNDMKDPLDITLAVQWWKYSLKFEGKIQHRNLLAEFPQLQDDLDAGRYEGERHDAITSFGEAPFGILFGAGGPGSGKTSFAIGVVKAIISRPHEAAKQRQPSRQGPSTQVPTNSAWARVFAAAKAKEASTQDSRTAVVAWTAAQNNSVDYAVHRLHDACPGKTICRALPYQIELSNVLVDDPSPPKMIDMDSVGYAASQDKQLAAHVNQHRVKSFEARSPSVCFGTISSLAKVIAHKDKDEWREYHDAMIQRQRDPEMFKLKHKYHLGVARKLLKAAAQACDVVCGTPVALSQLANQTDWKPDFVVLNDAARMRESVSAILLSTFPRSACLFIGDTSQVPCKSLVKGDSKAKTISGRQRTVSLLARVESMGRLNFSLRKTQRA